MTLPYDYANWKNKQDWFDHPDLRRVLPVLSSVPETVGIESLYEEVNDHFALASIWDRTFGEGLVLGYLILYEHKSTFVYNPNVRFATYEYDYEVPVSIINAIYHDMKENCISRRNIVASIGQFVEHRLYRNKWGPGDGYYESIGYDCLDFEDTPLLEEFRHEFPFMIGLSVPELITILDKFAKANGYCTDSRQDVKVILITLHQLLLPCRFPIR